MSTVGPVAMSTPTRGAKTIATAVTAASVPVSFSLEAVAHSPPPRGVSLCEKTHAAAPSPPPMPWETTPMQGRSFPLGPFPAAPCSRRSEADQEAPSISPEPSVTEGVLEPSLAGRPKEPAANAELAAAATATTNSAVASIPRTSGLSQPDTRANGARATAVPQSGTETAGFNRNQPDTIWLCKRDSALPCGRSDDSPPCSNPRNASPPRRGVFCWAGL